MKTGEPLYVALVTIGVGLLLPAYLKIERVTARFLADVYWSAHDAVVGWYRRR
jgi:hypothetical protein